MPVEAVAKNPAHFFALCARIIWQILVDHARKGRYAKRGGGQVLVHLDESLLGTRTHSVDLEALKDALTELEKVDTRVSREPDRCRLP